MKCSVLLTHVNMTVDAWRRYKDTNVFAKTVTLELTVKVRMSGVREDSSNFFKCNLRGLKN